jgi:uncharacterized phage protein (TIGR02218 family)
MRTIPSALQAKLNSGATTLCRCYVLSRADGVVLGFTDHDADIVIDGVTCNAGTGLTASEVTTRLGLAVDGNEIFGALADEALTEADLAAGRYDAATVDTWLVDWSEPSLRVLLSVDTLGEVRRDGGAFTAELRSITDKLNLENGRLFTATCSADLGDARCTVALDNDTFRGFGAVGTLKGISVFAASGLDAFADGWFTAGHLIFTSGANADSAVEVKLHTNAGGAVTLTLWQAMAEPIAAGDTFIVKAGCDKRFNTCRARFDNGVNFRGFPHIPGNDFVVRYPRQGEPGNDGGSLL